MFLRRSPAPRFCSLLAVAALGLATGAQAGTLVDLSASASRPAPNDLVQAVVFAEASGSGTGDLAQKVNSAVAEGLRTAKGYKGVKAQSGGTTTYPIYGKSGRIESWRMRSDITLEARDAAALSELLGKLQATLGVAGVHFLPAPETQKKIEDEAMVDALAAFNARAKLVGDTLGKAWRVKQLSIGSSGGRPPFAPRMKAALMAAEASPMPMEGGESSVMVNISGQIELAD
ncbi:hypothetical protein AZSI13_08990 [Azospira sp. I13]|uniref:SIMPL domain-containing protein n=1 Tax=Azospira sp. I13 TaxID=1765050 RepID=UPI000D3FC4AF|nr:SIMPL domain-containing protein [Azospira sp. I13]GBG01572.1 hypothetical protein AZSI13_08990 [Azospira sp. I13]